MIRESRRILVADDDRSICLAASEALANVGYQVLCVEDGQAALNAMGEFEPDVLLLDVRMPRLDGFETCRQVRRTFHHLPVLMLTGLEDTDSIERAYQVGATDFFIKPIQWLILQHRLRHILRASRTLVELRHAREAALAASQAKSRFLDNMSHELRTPLNAILGMTELVLESELNPEQHDFLSTVRQSAERLANMIGQVLDFSKIESGEIEICAREFCLQDALRDALLPLAHEARLKGLELACSISPQVPAVVEADEDRLRQVLTALAHNAVKFTEEGRVLIEVSVQAESDRELSLRLDIRDTGVGISYPDQEAVFESFVQADGSFTRPFEGAGLGLTIAARLVRLMAGRLWLESRPGQGSTFSFVLPVLKASVEALKTSDHGWLQGLHVLVAEAHPDSRRILQENLQLWGCRVETAATGADALDAMARCAADNRAVQLALVGEDLTEPGGMELSKRIRQDPAWREIPVLILSSQDGRSASRHCDSYEGFNAVLPKPVLPAHLLEALLAWAPLFRPGTGQTGQDRCGPWRVLLLDSDRIHRRMAERLLQRWGLQVVATERPQGAARAMREHRFHLLLASDDFFRPSQTENDLQWIEESRVPVAVFSEWDQRPDTCRQGTARLGKPIRKRELLPLLEQQLVGA